MNRCLAFLLAILLASITISSACVAKPADWAQFTLRAQPGTDRLKASFSRDGDGRGEHQWSTGLKASELIGLSTGFYTAGSRPLAFAVVREAGRLDCSGSGGGGYATGNCRFAADPAFTQALVSRGIARPTEGQAFSLMAVNARRELVEAIAAARYPTPSIDDLMALRALGVNGRYIADLSRAGYRPQDINSLIEFKALNITPEWIGGLVRIGYANIPSSELVQLKALNITADYIAGFDRVGYRHLPASTLVQFKAVGVTPEFAAAAQLRRAAQPSADELVQMRVLGHR
jgi:hypothetical protein